MTIVRTTTIELHKENMKFSAGHFTVFSKTQRENLHGHNYTVYAAFDTVVDENGMGFVYAIYKEALYGLCRELNQITLLPEHSPYLRFEEVDNQILVHFADEIIPFLKRDVKMVPLTNISIEELAQWFVDRLVGDEQMVQQHKVRGITVKVYSGPGQCASARWESKQ